MIKRIFLCKVTVVMCYLLLCCDSVPVKYGWMDLWVNAEVTNLKLELFIFFYIKITTEVSNWTEEEPATSDACESNSNLNFERPFHFLNKSALNLDLQLTGVCVCRVCVGFTHIFLCFLRIAPPLAPPHWL